MNNYNSIERCPCCGSKEVNHNGTYPAINYLLKLLCILIPCLQINYTSRVQKFACKHCGCSFKGEEQVKNIHFRDAMKNSIVRLIVILRFHLGVSVRGISEVISEVFGAYASLGFIDSICQKVSAAAAVKMEIINHCCQNKARVFMFDETFPKAKDSGCINLGVATCENGLIRKVGIIDTTKKSISLNRFFKSIITDNYKPEIFMSDYDISYPPAIKKIIPAIIIIKDIVHTVRQINKDKKSAINKVTVTFSSSIKITKEKQKKIIDLKKALIRKQLNRILYKMLKGFKAKNCAVGTLYIEGGLTELKEFTAKFRSLKPLYNKLNKFIKKYIKTWNIHMELYSKGKTPLTSNIIESKNSIFKAFSKKSKSYSSKHLENFFCGVALYENFDIKTRGVNKGTNAIMRAGIDLNEFGANNFYDAVGIPYLIKSKDFSKIITKTQAYI